MWLFAGTNSVASTEHFKDLGVGSAGTFPLPPRKESLFSFLQVSCGEYFRWFTVDYAANLLQTSNRVFETFWSNTQLYFLFITSVSILSDTKMLTVMTRSSLACVWTLHSNFFLHTLKRQKPGITLQICSRSCKISLPPPFPLACESC